jgi:S1-C subfamily serine protease
MQADLAPLYKASTNMDHAKSLSVWQNGSVKASVIRILMKIFRARICKQETLLRSVVFCLGLFIAFSPLRAQSSKASTSVPAKRSALDNSFDPLQQVSTSLQMLSKQVRPSVVQIFSTAYMPDSGREHRNTDLLSRGLTSGSGFIIASDGWIVTNAHVVQGGRRIRVQLSHEAALSARQNGGSRHALFDAKLVVADRDTDLALLKIETSDLPTLELSDSSDLKQGQLVLAFGSPLAWLIHQKRES